MLMFGATACRQPMNAIRVDRDLRLCYTGTNTNALYQYIFLPPSLSTLTSLQLHDYTRLTFFCAIPYTYSLLITPPFFPPFPLPLSAPSETFGNPNLAPEECSPFPIDVLEVGGWVGGDIQYNTIQLTDRKTTTIHLTAQPHSYTCPVCT